MRNKESEIRNWELDSMNVTPWTMNHQLYAIPMKNNWEKRDWEILRFQFPNLSISKFQNLFYAWKLSQNSLEVLTEE